MQIHFKVSNCRDLYVDNGTCKKKEKERKDMIRMYWTPRLLCKVFSGVYAPSEASLVKWPVWETVLKSFSCFPLSWEPLRRWRGWPWVPTLYQFLFPTEFDQVVHKCDLIEFQPPCLRRTSSVSDTDYGLSKWTRPRIELQFNVNPWRQQAMLLFTFLWKGHCFLCFVHFASSVFNSMLC